jgi:TPR repeat protein
VAVCYETGACGWPKDMAKAKEIYRKACDGGFRQSCARLQQIEDDEKILE